MRTHLPLPLGVYILHNLPLILQDALHKFLLTYMIYYLFSTYYLNFVNKFLFLSSAITIIRLKPINSICMMVHRFRKQKSNLVLRDLDWMGYLYLLNFLVVISIFCGKAVLCLSVDQLTDFQIEFLEEGVFLLFNFKYFSLVLSHCWFRVMKDQVLLSHQV